MRLREARRGALWTGGGREAEGSTPHFAVLRRGWTSTTQRVSAGPRVQTQGGTSILQTQATLARLPVHGFGVRGSRRFGERILARGVQPLGVALLVGRRRTLLTSVVLQGCGPDPGENLSG